MAFSFRDARTLAQQTFKEFSEDKVTNMAAALSYYTVFSLPPLLVLIVAIAGFVWGQEAAQGRIVSEMGGLLGRQGAEAIQEMIQNANRPGSGSVVAMILGIVTLLVGATGAFVQLQDALNTAWDIQREEGGLKNLLFKRLLSFGMIFGIAFLLLVSLAVSAALSAFGEYLEGMVSSPALVTVFHVLNLAVSLVVFAFLFSAIFKIMPDAVIAWKDVWVGGTVTALLFVAGKFLIGFYLGQSEPGSAFGAAGSLAIILVWIYYSSIIILLGAEFTQVYARHTGKRIVPEKGAVFIVERKQHVPPGQPRPAGIDADGLSRRDEIKQAILEKTAPPEGGTRHDWRKG